MNEPAPGCVSFLDLWRRVAARTGKPIPAWRDFTPAELAPHAGMLLVQDFTDRAHPTVRFAGPEIERLLGAYAESDRGSRMTAADREIVDPARFQALDTPCGLRIIRHFQQGKATNAVNVATTLALPATDLPGEIAFLLVASEMQFPMVGDGTVYEYKIARIEFLDLGFGVPGPDFEPGREIHARFQGSRFLDE